MDHVVEITVLGTQVVQKSLVLTVGDTVRYTCEDGEVTVEFELPFGNTVDVIHHGETRTFGRAGRFVSKCYVTLNGPEPRTRIGWSPTNLDAGGEHDVRPGP